MSIIIVEIESIHGAENEQRFVFYRAQDDSGAWHSYGPVITVDAKFDPEAFKTTVGQKIENRLTEQAVRQKAETDLKSAETKALDYVRAQRDVDLKAILTDDEIAALRK